MIVVIMIENAIKPIAVSQEMAAKLLDIDRRKISRAVRNGELTPHQNGASVRLLVSDIEAWIRTWPQPAPRKPRARKDF
ncbi:helix-turn-helix domain-containing protein [Bradyrhizobium commune]|uniref:Helix-turn-helix domain-containing protein n=1 Tax=Bradyrhizobium commune TaxID=83627 RepID=A0A7S9D5J2_9BRAD|nr:helix-turn-helix domain-containing protein [Bradyrhizobium commune]QPF91473.1 helix-turn-helix domain-containing protein [Bradyrhizobium commune]